MEKKVAILVRAGMPYKETIAYGCARARESGAKPLLVGVIPKIDLSRRVGIATHEMVPYRELDGSLERESTTFLERAVQFCLDSGIAVESRLEPGGIDGAIDTLAKDGTISLVVMPTPVGKEHHSELLEAIRALSSDMLGPQARCPVVSVLAA